MEEFLRSSAWSYWAKLVTLAYRGVRAQRLSAFLSASGITVGVAAVVAILAIGEGAREEALSQVRHLGTNNIIVRKVQLTERRTAAGMTGTHGLTLEDANRLKRISPHIAEVTPAIELWRAVATSAKEVKARVVGATPETQETNKLAMEVGRFLVPDDGRQRRPVCVLGAQTSRDLFRLDNPLGRKIQLGVDWFQVVGVLQNRAVLGGEKAVVRTHDINRDIYVPLETLAPAAETREAWPVDELTIVVDKETKVLETAQLVRLVLERTHRGARNYEVIVPLELLKQRTQTQRVFNAVLAGAAALSLLVGGIGIMNIMLATVTERTPEVGVRRAVGATAQDIALQFLVETATLTVLGGIVGVTLGVGASVGLHLLWGWPVKVSLVTVSGVLTIALFCGVVFGLYPAIKAAAADPIDALRYE